MLQSGPMGDIQAVKQWGCFLEGSLANLIDQSIQYIYLVYWPKVS